MIDLTNDADDDDDLRRAMQASLQEHQSQQTYRPPAPSSTVGVSSTTATPRRNSTDHKDTIDQGPVTCQQIDEIDFVDTSSRLPTRAEIRAMFDEDDEMPSIAHVEQQAAQKHGYRLRDRSSLAQPTKTVQTLFDTGRYTQPTRTYGSRASRRPGQVGRARRDRRGCRKRSWSMVRFANMNRSAERLERGPY